MPFAHGNIRFQNQLFQPLKLIVDQRLQGTDIQYSHRCGRVVVKLCQHRQKCRLCFSRSRAGGKEQIGIRVENHLAGSHLDAPQLFPVIVINVVLYKRRKPCKRIHYNTNSAKSLCISSSGRPPMAISKLLLPKIWATVFWGF